MDTFLIMQSEAANVVPNHIAFARIFGKSSWHFICHSGGFQCVLNDHENKKVASKKMRPFLSGRNELHYRGHGRRM